MPFVSVNTEFAVHATPTDGQSEAPAQTTSKEDASALPSQEDVSGIVQVSGVNDYARKAIVIRLAMPSDEEFAFRAECSYFDGHPTITAADMEARWAGSDAWPRREFRQLTALGRTRIALAADAVRVGYIRWAACTEDGSCPSGASNAIFIGHVYVEPSQRRKGIAHQLLDAACQDARSEGYSVACLSVEPWNTAAHALYLKAGFARAKDGDKENLLIKWIVEECNG